MRPRAVKNPGVVKPRGGTHGTYGKLNEEAIKLLLKDVDKGVKWEASVKEKLSGFRKEGISQHETSRPSPGLQRAIMEPIPQPEGRVLRKPRRKS